MLSISLSKGSSWEQLFSEDSKSPTSKKPRPKCTKPAISISVQASTPFSQNGNIMTLPKSDSSLYGFFPEIEPFALCVCSICNLTLKPQGLLKHMMKRHGRRVKENKINGSIQLAKPAKLLKNIKLKTSNIESSSSTSSSSNVNSDEEVISANVLTPITSKSNVNLSAPVEIEPTMSPLSEILKQIEDGSNDVPEITDCSSSSDHFKEVQKIIKSFEDVERSQVNYNDETFSKEEKERQTKMLTEILSKQEKFESNDLQAFNLLLNRSATKQDKLNLLNGSDHLVFMFIETDEQFQDLVFDRIGLCDAIKKVTENTLAADFPHPRAPDHEKKFKEVYQDLINTRHLLMDKYVPSSFLDVPSLAAVLPRPYKTNIYKNPSNMSNSCLLTSFLEMSLNNILNGSNSLESLKKLNLELVNTWKFSHVTSFNVNFENWSYERVENLLQSCLDFKLWRYACETEKFHSYQRSTLLLNTISLLRFTELWSFLKQNYYQHLEQYQYYRYQLGNVDANIINDITKILPLLQRRCVDLQIYIRETAIRIAYILNLQLYVLSMNKELKQESKLDLEKNHSFSNEYKSFVPFQNLANNKNDCITMIDTLWLDTFNKFYKPENSVQSFITLNAVNMAKKYSLDSKSSVKVLTKYKRVTNKIITTNTNVMNFYRISLILNDLFSNDLFLKVLKKEKIDLNSFANRVLPKGIDFLRKGKCGCNTIFCVMMDNDLIVDQNEKDKLTINRFLKNNSKTLDESNISATSLLQYYIKKLNKVNNRLHFDENLSNLAKQHIGGLNYLKYLTLLMKLRKFEGFDSSSILKGCFYVFASLEQRINDLSNKPLAESIAELFPAKLSKILSTRVRTRDIFISLSSGRYERVRERIAKKKNLKQKHNVNGKAVKLSVNSPQPLRINTYNIVKFGKSRSIFRKEYVRARRFGSETSFGNTEKNMGSNREKDLRYLKNVNLNSNLYNALRNKYF